MLFRFLFIVLLTIPLYISSQTREHSYGTVFSDEFALRAYDKDPEASALYLYERGDVHFEAIENGIWIVKKYYAKIKVFDKDKFDANVDVYFRNGERVRGLRATTHNDSTKAELHSKDFLESHKYGRWNAMSFAFENVQNGSILEYVYRVESPYHFALEDWTFQSEYPKVLSELYAKINLNYRYKKSLVGKKRLDIENTRIDKGCLWVEGFSNPADCEYLHLGMKDIPAFVEEDFMLSSRNYASRIVFDLQEYINLSGRKFKYIKNWREIDEEYQKDGPINKYLNQKNYFKNKIPKEILAQENELKKAKQIFTYFQNHYTWNDYLYRINYDLELKEAYNKRVGDIGEINLALLNAFQALDYKAHAMLLPTRNAGLTNDLFPNLYDFNYLVVRLEIDNEVYLLDATDKFVSFGMLPFRCLNHRGRVMDYNGKSFWQDISVNQKSVHQISVQAVIDADGTFSGKINERNIGYFARDKREELSEKSIEDYRQIKEKSYTNIELSNLDINNKENNDLHLVESFDFNSQYQELGDKILLTPFLYSFFKKNPLTLESRTYPLEFGYPQTYVYQVSIDIGDDFIIESLPQSRAIRLPDNSSEVSLAVSHTKNKIDLRFTFTIGNQNYAAENYNAIKDLFYNAINIMNNEHIILQKQIN